MPKISASVPVFLSGTKAPVNPDVDDAASINPD